MTVLSLNQYSYTYAGSRKATLSALSLGIEEGDWLWVCGKSGAGKSTLLQVFDDRGQEEGIEEGEIFWGELPLAKYSHQERLEKIAYYHFEDSSFSVFKTVRDALIFRLLHLGWSEQKVHKRLAELCRYLSLEDDLDKEVENLSGGQRQLVYTASLLMSDPDILILDEPLTQLDPIAQQRYLQALQQIQEETNVTILISGHDPCMMTWADKILLLEDGEKRFYGGKESFCRHYWKHPIYADYIPDIPYLALSLQGDKLSKLPFGVRDGRELADQAYLCKDIKKAPLGEEVSFEARQLVFGYESDQCLLRNISLSLREGECFYILGANGSGKSSLLRVLCGLEKAWEGRIYFQGKPLKAPLPYLSQSIEAYFTGQTLGEIIQNHLCRLEEAQQARKWLEALAFTSEALKGSPFDLAQGHKHLFALWLVLSRESAIYFLDEPTGDLDPVMRKLAGEMMREKLDQGKTLLLCGHDLNFCGQMAHGAAFLFDGHLTPAQDSIAFLRSNRYYTTDLNRLFKGKEEGLVLREQVLWEKDD